MREGLPATLERLFPAAPERLAKPRLTAAVEWFAEPQDMKLIATLGPFDIGQAAWQDVDTPQALAYAESIFDQRFYQMPSEEGFASV